MEPTRVWLTTLLLGALLAVPGAPRAQVSAEVDLRAAMETETVEGDLHGAIEQYRQIAEGDDRASAATALVRMAGCYEKLGTDEARHIYRQVLEEYPDQTALLALARDGLSRLTVSSTPPSPTMMVRELMRATGKPQPGEGQAIPGPGFAVSSDGQLFVYTDWTTGDLASKNMATGEVRSFYGTDWASSEFFEDPVLSPDDTHVVFVRYPNISGTGVTTRIEMDSIEGGSRRTVYDSNASRNMFTRDWSPDGEHILFSSEADDRSVFLATVGLGGESHQRLVTLDWEHPRGARYSPDGRFIAYDSTKGGDRRIYLISADGAQEHVLVDSPGEDDSPLWTRDGRFLLFRSNRSGQWDLYALGMQNGQPSGDEVLITSNLGSETFLRGVTAEGRLLAYERLGGRDVAIAERIDTTVQTAQVRVLPKIQTTVNRAPTFTPDGERVAYLTGLPSESSGRKIRITDLDGKILKQFALESGFNTVYPPTFSHDGKKLALRVYDRRAAQSKILVLSAATGARLQLLTPLPPGEKGYAKPLGWSRDSGHLYAFVTPEAGAGFLASIDTETAQVVETTVLSEDVDRVWLSPSESHLVMLASFYGSSDAPAGQQRTPQIVLRSLDDGSERLLKEVKITPFIRWDFDSRHLFYRKADDEKPLYRFSIETGEETVVVEDMQDLGLVSVSPGGKYWALQKRGAEQTRIWALENFLPERPASGN